MYTVGQILPHNKLKFLTKEEIDKNLYIQDFKNIRLPFNYGLIFKSTEFPHPKGERIPDRDEIEFDLLTQVKDCKGDPDCDWDIEC